MVEPLIQLFQSLAPFTREDLEDALPYFQPVTVVKHGFFNNAGRISGRLGFVVTGILRSFYILKGKETTTFFQLPGDIAVDLKSFVQRTPSIEAIQAVTDSQLLVIERKDLYALYEEDWKWQQVGRMLVENAYFEMEERSIFLQTHSAHDRYLRFLAKYPEVVRQVPLQHVASFLGISPETLSRIRKTI
jgi:CRP-like cAMP-binding protein